MSKLINCKTCDHEISSNAKSCPNCGERVKKTKWIRNIIIFILLFFAYIIITLESPTNTISSQPIPTESEYKERSEPLNYRSALLGELNEGALVTARGEIVQSLSGNKFRLATENTGLFGYSGDDVLINLPDNPGLVDEDIIKIKARYISPITYKTVLGSEKTIPSLWVDYYEIISKK